tara:strand:+ start:61 stop:492 length:432 start_codon:yes stop_codon:yes gene_type:complete
MIKIYCIEDINGNKYIGSTGQPLKHRLLGHKNKDNKCSSNKLDLYNSFIYTIEECNQDDKKEREQYWIDNTDCVNINNTIFDGMKKYNKQYNIDNRDKRKQYSIDNRDKKNEYDKQIRNYRKSWGGDKRWNNNLLEIDIDIFH